MRSIVIRMVMVPQPTVVEPVVIVIVEVNPRNHICKYHTRSQTVDGIAHNWIVHTEVVDGNWGLRLTGFAACTGRVSLCAPNLTFEVPIFRLEVSSLPTLLRLQRSFLAAGHVFRGDSGAGPCTAHRVLFLPH